MQMNKEQIFRKELEWLRSEAKIRLKSLKIPINNDTETAVLIGYQIASHKWLESFDNSMREQGLDLLPRTKLVRKRLCHEEAEG